MSVQFREKGYGGQTNRPTLGYVVHLRWPADHSDRDRHKCGATGGLSNGGEEDG